MALSCIYAYLSVIDQKHNKYINSLAAGLFLISNGFSACVSKVCETLTFPGPLGVVSEWANKDTKKGHRATSEGHNWRFLFWTLKVCS